MNERYLDIMEKALSAYSDERIREYIDEVKENGLKEHGFPRLGANIGILLAYGRRPELLPVFIEIMDICCEQMPQKKAANDFSVREVCCSLMLLEKKGIVDPALISKWKGQLSLFDPWTRYTQVAKSPDTPIENWACFAAVSDFVRGVWCGVDTAKFVDWEVSSQLLNLDEIGMYKDPHNPMMYDLVPRTLLTFLLRFGYEGKHKPAIERMLDNTLDLTLKMQSVTGELPFGGRSNQFVLCEAWLASYFELEALRMKDKGDLTRAGQCKAAARLAADNMWHYLSLDPIHHIKNRYDLATKIGCEHYGYFNKYMITVASNLYMGALFADESIEPTVAPTEAGGYVISTGPDFHKTFLNAGGYFLEFDTAANLGYDASGLGRVHKTGCPGPLCLSVPFPKTPASYQLEGENPGPAALGLVGAAGKPYTLRDYTAAPDRVTATFDCAVGSERYEVSETGVEITYSRPGFTLPVFAFDGEKDTDISVEDHRIEVRYENAVCTYRFDGTLKDYQVYYNRNGRYRVYTVDGQRLHIEIKEL